MRFEELDPSESPTVTDATRAKVLSRAGAMHHRRRFASALGSAGLIVALSGTLAFAAVSSGGPGHPSAVHAADVTSTDPSTSTGATSTTAADTTTTVADTTTTAPATTTTEAPTTTIAPVTTDPVCANGQPRGTFHGRLSDFDSKWRDHHIQVAVTTPGSTTITVVVAPDGTFTVTDVCFPVSHLDVSDDTDGQHCDVNDPKVEDGKDVNVTTHWDKSGSNDNPPTAPLGEQPPSHDGPSSNGSSQGGDGGGSSHGGHGH